MNNDYEKGKDKKIKDRARGTLGKLTSDEELEAEDAGQKVIGKPQGPYSNLGDRIERKGQ